MFLDNFLEDILIVRALTWRCPFSPPLAPSLLLLLLHKVKNHFSPASMRQREIFDMMMKKKENH